MGRGRRRRCAPKATTSRPSPCRASSRPMPTDRPITIADHVNAIADAVRAADAPVVLAVHSATGFSGLRRERHGARSDRSHGLRRHGARRGRAGPRLRRCREADGLGRDQGGGESRRPQRGAAADLPAAGGPGARRRDPRGCPAHERRAPRHPSTLICTGFTAEQYQTYAREDPESASSPALPSSATSPGSTCRPAIGRCGRARGARWNHC